MNPKIGLVYLSYHSDPHLEDFLASLKNMTYPKNQVEVIVVDNPHPEYGLSTRAITELLLPAQGTHIPRVTLLSQTTNVGFAEGNNIGAKHALGLGCEYVIFHNDDGFFAPTGVETLVRSMVQNPRIGMAQALVLLYPDTEYINSKGNGYHYLGFGFANGYREKRSSLMVPEVSDVPYASGAAVIVSTEAIKTVGLWDPDFFLYHEDLEWSFRMRVLGYRVVLVRDAVFYHKYQFGRSIQKFFYQQRNRYAVLLMYYKIPTLLLIAPMFVVLEAGLWVFAIKNKWLDKQVEVYKYWFKKDSWRLWLNKRKNIQGVRTISDRVLLKNAVGSIHFQEEMMRNPLLVYMGNPLMELYFTFVKLVLWW